jgi:hypothetical protein
MAIEEGVADGQCLTIAALGKSIGAGKMGQSCCTSTSESAVVVTADDKRSHHVGPPLGEASEEIRVDKILDIRRQLAEGTYSIEDRLDLIVDRIIDELREV